MCTKYAFIHAHIQLTISKKKKVFSILLFSTEVHNPLHEHLLAQSYIYIYIYMGSSSMLVLIGSHSRCNSFVVNEFLFFFPFHTKWRKFPRSNDSNAVEKICFVYFLLAKYTPMSRKNGGQKREWRYPTACVGSYFIPDENIQTYLICLQSCNMQKHQKANFRPAEYVCVQ